MARFAVMCNAFAICPLRAAGRGGFLVDRPPGWVPGRSWRCAMRSHAATRRAARAIITLDIAPPRPPASLIFHGARPPPRCHRPGGLRPRARSVAPARSSNIQAEVIEAQKEAASNAGSGCATMYPWPLRRSTAQHAASALPPWRDV